MCVRMSSWLCLGYAVMCACFRAFCVFTHFPVSMRGREEALWTISSRGKSRAVEHTWVRGSVGISAPAAHAQRRGRIEVRKCIRACLPGIALFHYFLLVLVYAGASFRAGSPICIYIRPGVCVSGDRPLRRGPPAFSGICALSRHDSLHVPSNKLSSQTWHHRQRHTFPSGYCILFWGRWLRLIYSVCFFLCLFCWYVCSFSSPFRLIDHLPPGHCFDTWLYFCVSFIPPCTVLHVHMLSICA